jgi:putative ferrous iron transport protein C
MTLSALKTYVQENHVVSMNDLTAHFDMDADTLRDMLEILIRKNQVRKIQDADVHCGKCAQCHLLNAELYEWVEH